MFFQARSKVLRIIRYTVMTFPGTVKPTTSPMLFVNEIIKTCISLTIQAQTILNCIAFLFIIVVYLRRQIFKIFIYLDEFIMITNLWIQITKYSIPLITFITQITSFSSKIVILSWTSILTNLFNFSPVKTSLFLKPKYFSFR